MTGAAAAAAEVPAPCFNADLTLFSRDFHAVFTLL